MEVWRKLKEKSKTDPMFSRELLGVVAVGAGVAGTVGYASYANYRQGLELAQKTSALLREQGRVIAMGIERALAPEIQRFSEALIQKNASNAAQGLAKLTAAESEALIRTGLQSPNVKERIIASLTRTLSNSSARETAKETAELIYHSSIRDSRGIIARNWNNLVSLSEQGIVQVSKFGTSIAKPIAEKIMPYLSKASTQRILAGLARSSGKGVLATCARWARGIFKPRVAGALGGSVLTVAMILLEPSHLAAGTMDAAYTENPASLLALNEEQARHWIHQYSSVRTSLMSLGLVSLNNPEESHYSEENGICEGADEVQPIATEEQLQCS